MAIDKLIPQYLNSDTDQKLVKTVEMTDNLNVRVSTEDSGTDGVLKNIKGTELVTRKTINDSLPTGDNRVIGSVSNDTKKEVIFFNFNSNGNHGVYKIESNLDKIVKVYQDSVLNFQKFSHVDCDYIVNEAGETIVYFTDDFNPPMKINVDRMIAGQYPLSTSTGTDAQKLLSLTAIKPPPLKAPKFSLVNNSSVNGNNINEKVFQFAYKYIYEDGEHSALSPYSSLAFARNQLKDFFISEGAKNFFNQIDVYVQNSISDVKEIVLYAKSRDTFYEVEKIDNTYGTGFTTINFTNNILGNAISVNEVSKTYDNVPQKAKTISVANNRLMLGNYTEGYPNVDADIELIAAYNAKPISYDINLTLLTSGTYSIPRIEVDFSELPATIKAGSTLSINFIIDLGELSIGGSIGGSNVLFGEDISLADGELQVSYETRDDTTSIQRDVIAVNRLQGDSFLSNYFSAFAVSYGIPQDFNPALTFNSEGIHIAETISVGVDTPKATIQSTFISSITGKSLDAFLNPGTGSRRLTVLRHQVANLFSEKGAFKGVGKFKLFEVSNTTDTVQLDLKLQNIEIELFEFLKNGTKPTNVISTNKIKLEAYTQSTRQITPYINEAKIIEGATAVITSIEGYRSFKSGATHKLGIVYLDDRGRSSGVQEAGDVYIDKFNERSATFNQNGASYVNMKVKHNPPSWASKWMPVYTGMGNSELKFSYSIGGAFAATNNLERVTTTTTKKKIYLSVNTAFGKNGFNKSFGADLQYKHEIGDKLRIVNYSRGLKFTTEFKVSGMETLTDDLKTNPILDRINEQAISVTTGDFIVIEDNGVFPFSYASIVNNISKWFDNCIIEIVRQQKETEEYIYYELGQTYDITGNQHESDRPSYASSFSVTVSDFKTDFVTINSSVRMWVGDTFTSSGDTFTIVTAEYIGGEYVYQCSFSNGPYIINQTFNVTANDTDAIISLYHGDLYYRPRLLYAASEQMDTVGYRSAGSMPAVVDFIEDYSVSDFFSSKKISKGKPYGYIPESKTMRRAQSVTYSDVYTADVDRLGFSSFNLSMGNWQDLDIEYGKIDKIISRGDALTVLQHRKASQIPLGRNLIEYADGSKNLTASKKVLGTPSYYAGNFGTAGNPESVVERFGVVYYTDLDSRKVIRLSNDGITPITDKGMDGFFQKIFEGVSLNIPIPRLVGGFDPDNDEYIITVEDLSSSFIYIGNSDPELEATPYEVTLDVDGNYNPLISYTSNSVIWNNINFNWNDICLDWDDVGNGILNIQDNTLNIDSSWIGSTSTINILMTNNANSFLAVAQYNIGEGTIILPTSTCDGDTVSKQFGGSESEGLTIAYKHKKAVWASKYSFKPSNYASIGNKLYSFFGNTEGLVWKHNTNERRNYFYGEQFSSMFESVSNKNPSMVKVFEALSVEGSGNWTSFISTENQETSITYFTEREGNQYSVIPRDTLNSKSHQIFLGIVSAIAGSSVTFTAPVNRIPFAIGDSIKTASGSILTPTGDTITGVPSRKVLTMSGANFNIGDKIFVEKLSSVDGDPIRNTYAKIKMTSDSQDAFEVHALSLSYDRSAVHNDRVN